MTSSVPRLGRMFLTTRSASGSRSVAAGVAGSPSYPIRQAYLDCLREGIFRFHLKSRSRCAVCPMPGQDVLTKLPASGYRLVRIRTRICKVRRCDNRPSFGAPCQDCRSGLPGGRGTSRGSRWPAVLVGSAKSPVSWPAVGTSRRHRRSGGRSAMALPHRWLTSPPPIVGLAGSDRS